MTWENRFCRTVPHSLVHMSGRPEWVEDDDVVVPSCLPTSEPEIDDAGFQAVGDELGDVTSTKPTNTNTAGHRSPAISRRSVLDIIA
jgi:hypothetical protein